MNSLKYIKYKISSAIYDRYHNIKDSLEVKNSDNKYVYTVIRIIHNSNNGILTVVGSYNSIKKARAVFIEQVKLTKSTYNIKDDYLNNLYYLSFNGQIRDDYDIHVWICIYKTKVNIKNDRIYVLASEKHEGDKINVDMVHIYGEDNVVSGITQYIKERKNFIKENLVDIDADYDDESEPTFSIKYKNDYDHIMVTVYYKIFPMIIT